MGIFTDTQEEAKTKTHKSTLSEKQELESHLYEPTGFGANGFWLGSQCAGRLHSNWEGSDDNFLRWPVSFTVVNLFLLHLLKIKSIFIAV